MNEMNEEIEINLSELFQVLKKNLNKIIITTLVCMIVAALATIFLISKKYESTARIFPKPQTNSGLVSDYNQINTNNAMVNNYVELIKGSNILGEVADELKMERKEIEGALSVSSQTDTMIISVTATTTDPKLSKQIVDTTLKVFYAEVKEKLDINNIMTVDKAEIAEEPSSPSFKKNLLIGAVLGIFVSCGYVFIKFMLDTRIHSKDEAEKYFELPVLGVIPFFEE